jgi:metallo-beta-lactamase family protein
MRILFAGAARDVTGSQHLLEFKGTRLLLDCGVNQGRRKESCQRNRHLSFDPRQVDAMILSHAHIDHSANIPTLVSTGSEAPSLAPRPPAICAASCSGT